MAAIKSNLLGIFTNLNKKGRLLLLLAFIFVLLLLVRKARHSDIMKSEPVFRRILKRIGSSEDEFCLVSYNILADGPVKRQPNGYLPLPMAEKLKEPNPKTSPRHKQLMKELQWLNPDVINMQEVETSYFAVLQEDLGESGFKGVHKPHYKAQNGLATFYNAQRFKMQKSVTYNFNELLSKIFDLGQFEHENKHNQRVVIFSHLTEVKTGKPIVIANLHSMFGSWRQPDMQALQISLFFQKLHEFITSLQENSPVPWIISGDFNTYPNFPLYAIISTGNVSNDGLERLNPNKYKYPQVVEKSQVREGQTVILKDGRKYLNHPLKDIKSAYKTALGREPLLTHYQINKDFPTLYGFDVMKGTLDYIWYSSGTLNVNAVLQHVKEDVITPLVACPNKYFPSDHLSMKACFGFGKSDDR